MKNWKHFRRKMGMSSQHPHVITQAFMLSSKDTVYPKKYAHGFVVLCFVVVMQSFIMNSHGVFIHIHQGCFAGTGAIVRLPQCQWSKPDGYGKISQAFMSSSKDMLTPSICLFCMTQNFDFNLLLRYISYCDAHVELIRQHTEYLCCFLAIVWIHSYSYSKYFIMVKQGISQIPLMYAVRRQRLELTDLIFHSKYGELQQYNTQTSLGEVGMKNKLGKMNEIITTFSNDRHITIIPKIITYSNKVNCFFECHEKT